VQRNYLLCARYKVLQTVQGEKNKPKDCYFLKMILFAHDAIKNVHGLKP
jgi:hypothetical protein